MTANLKEEKKNKGNIKQEIQLCLKFCEITI